MSWFVDAQQAKYRHSSLVQESPRFDEKIIISFRLIEFGLRMCVCNERQQERERERERES